MSDSTSTIAPATVVQSGSGFACSQCGGFVRQDADKCKHCGASFCPPVAAVPAGPEPTAHVVQQGNAYVCSDCGARVHPGARQCWQCKAVFPAPPPRKTARWFIPALVVIALIGIIGFFFSGSRQAAQQPIGIVTLVGYTEITTGNHISEINVWSDRSGTRGSRIIGTIHEGTVVPMYWHNNDDVLISTPNGQVGYITTLATKEYQ